MGGAALGRATPGSRRHLPHPPPPVGHPLEVPTSLPSPIADPAPVAHGPLAVAAVDVQGSGCLVEAVDGTARAQLDHLVGDVPELEALQQVNVGRVPVLLGIVAHTQALTTPQNLLRTQALHPKGKEGSALWGQEEASFPKSTGQGHIPFGPCWSPEAAHPRLEPAWRRREVPRGQAGSHLIGIHHTPGSHHSHLTITPISLEEKAQF